MLQNIGKDRFFFLCTELLGFAFIEIKNNKQHMVYFFLPTVLYSRILRFYLMYNFRNHLYKSLDSCRYHPLTFQHLHVMIWNFPLLLETILLICQEFHTINFDHIKYQPLSLTPLRSLLIQFDIILKLEEYDQHKLVCGQLLTPDKPTRSHILDDPFSRS